MRSTKLRVSDVGSAEPSSAQTPRSMGSGFASSAESPHVSFRNVRKTYDGDVLIVKDLNLDIKRGEFLTLLGPSGSGKSTCLMMLAGFEAPTSGDIRLGARLINQLPPHKRNIGVVFQNYALFPHMTVRENLRFPLVVRKLSATEIDSKVNKILKMIRLESFASRYPQQLSGGQQQRVALARALVFDPELVLMDEPLGALDKQLREHMQLEIKHIHQDLGVTVVFVTHDQSEALTMSDRIAVFDQGVIQQIDTASTLYEKPANSFVASFIGENNALQGTVEAETGRMCMVRLDCGIRLQATRGNAGIAASRATVSVRPERVMIATADVDQMNCVEANVLELIYLGDHVRVRMSIAPEVEVTMKTPISQLSGAITHAQKLRVCLPSEHLYALNPEGEQ